MFGKYPHIINTAIFGLLKQLELVDAAQDAWDANNVDGESADEKILRLGEKPTDITLAE